MFADMDGVVSIFPNNLRHLQTTRSWDFLGLSETIKRKPTVESDVIIELLDAGIWLESESFSDEDFGHLLRNGKVFVQGKNFYLQ